MHGRKRKRAACKPIDDAVRTFADAAGFSRSRDDVAHPSRHYRAQCDRGRRECKWLHCVVIPEGLDSAVGHQALRFEEAGQEAPLGNP